MKIPGGKLIATFSLVGSLLLQQGCNKYSEPVQVQLSYISEKTRGLLLIEVEPSNIEGRKIGDRVILEKETKKMDINGDGEEELISANITIKEGNYREGDYTIENLFSGNDKKPKAKNIVQGNIIEIIQEEVP